jgi:CcmD family protein
MNSIKFLYAAYIATWTIHGLYLLSLLRRYSRLRRQKKELGGPQSR